MKILGNCEQWSADFEAGWLRHYRETGTIDWKLYNRPKNTTAPASKGIDLSQSRLVLISSAGVYDPRTDEPFDAAHDLGDYGVRTFSKLVTFNDLAIAHDHYDHTAINEDPQVLLPIAHLNKMVAEGAIGSLAPEVVSFMGYQPDLRRVVDECTPEIVAHAKRLEANAALLVPA